MISELRGLFLTSEHAEITVRFYRTVAGLDLEQVGSEPGYVYWKLDRHGVQIAFHDARAFAEYSFPARRESNLTHLYFKIESHAGFLEHLTALDIVPDHVDDVTITVTDPDGRKVLFGTA